MILMERINKYLAHAGLGSRRHCEDLVLAGRVRVDGEIVRDLAFRVRDEQPVTVDGKPVEPEKHVYWAVHKPRGYLSTNHDPSGRPRIIDLVPHVGQRVYTVGRLDEDSEGLLLMTNDGDLANKLMHPRYGVEKTYHVQVAGSPTREDLSKLTEGIWLSEGRVKARSAKKFKSQGESSWVRIILAEGKNREIRRMLARLGHKVMRLIRVGVGPIELGKLKAGRNRPLTNVEVKRLRRLAEVITANEKAAEEGIR